MGSARSADLEERSGALPILRQGDDAHPSHHGTRRAGPPPGAPPAGRASAPTPSCARAVHRPRDVRSGGPQRRRTPAATRPGGARHPCTSGARSRRLPGPSWLGGLGPRLTRRNTKPAHGAAMSRLPRVARPAPAHPLENRLKCCRHVPTPAPPPSIAPPASALGREGPGHQIPTSTAKTSAARIVCRAEPGQRPWPLHRSGFSRSFLMTRPPIPRQPWSR
jgi:hypothetical protein